MSYSAIGYTSNPCASDDDCLTEELCCGGYCRQGIDIDEHCGLVVCPEGWIRIEGECVAQRTLPQCPPGQVPDIDTLQCVPTLPGKSAQAPQPTQQTTLPRQPDAERAATGMTIGMLALLAAGTWLGVKLLF